MYPVKTMNVLVTGGNGMVGRNFQEYVSVLENNEFNFFFASRQQLDLMNWDRTNDVFETVKPDIVVHLAADVGGVYYNNNNNDILYERNMYVNKTIMCMMKKYNIKYSILVLSTCVYSDDLTKDSIINPLQEEDILLGSPHVSNYGYALSKRVLYKWSKEQNGVKYICLVPTNMYGKYDYFDNLSKAHVIPALIGKLKNDVAEVCGDLKSMRQYLHVTDFVKVMYEILLHFKDGTYNHLYDVYNIVPKETTTNKELGDLIFGNDKYFNKRDDLAQFARIASYERFKEHFPDIFNNMMKLKDGLAELINMYA